MLLILFMLLIAALAHTALNRAALELSHELNFLMPWGPWCTALYDAAFADAALADAAFAVSAFADAAFADAEFAHAAFADALFADAVFALSAFVDAAFALAPHFVFSNCTSAVSSFWPSPRLLPLRCSVCLHDSQSLKYKIGGGGSLSISGPLRDPADISRCIVDVIWAPDLSIVKFLGSGSQIRLTLTGFTLF